MRTRSTLFLALSVASLAVIGCNGAIGGAGSDNPGSGNSTGNGSAGTGNNGAAGTSAGAAGTTGGGSTTGSAGVGVVPPAPPGSALQWQPVLRLADYEYQNSARDLLGIQANVTLEPDAPSTGGFRIGGPAGDNTVSVYHSAAITLAAQAMTTLSSVETCFGTAATGNAAAQTMCANTIIADLGAKAYRRPLDAMTTAGLTTVYTTLAAKYGFAVGIQSVIEAILQSPNFLYHLELEEYAKGAGKVAVTGYSLASRLSYFIWGSIPDATLISAAANGQLTTASQALTQAQRMVADQRAMPGMRNFYEQWLEILDLPLSKGDNTVTNINYGTLFTPSMQASIRASFDAQLDDAFWGGTDAVKALLTSTNAYVDANTAQLFNVTSTSATVQKVAVDPTQRAGILTHPAIMSIAATDTQSHLIKRGVFFWDKMLCQPLPDPPANVPPFVEPPPGTSLRNQYATFTSNAQTCQPCHAKINPVGDLFESYDTIGRYRTVDDVGQPVVTDAVIVGASDPKLNVDTKDAVAFSANLAANDTTVVNCMVTQFYRYAAHRQEGAADAPSVTTLQSGFNTSGRSVPSLLSQITQSEIFLNRLNAAQ
jgi:uncharacterized protein DUF1592/uncharacterized protein DUF1588/uncharacterized protein DUF1595/uncharacterized protein DUF1585